MHGKRIYALWLGLAAVLLMGASDEGSWMLPRADNRFCARWNKENLESRLRIAMAPIQLFISEEFGSLPVSEREALKACVETTDLVSAMDKACSIGSDRDYQAGFSQAASISKKLRKCEARRKADDAD